MEAYQLSKEELRSVQKTQWEMLCEVDRICRKRGIRYNIIAGTLLGAVRHSGFIPWDDDADVALLRPEYERFRAACETDLDKTRFLFQDSSVTKGYRWGYGKLRRKETLFLRKGQEDMPYHQGIFIDIFPLDGVPAGRLSRAFYNIPCFLVRKLMWSPVGARTERVPWKRGLYRLAGRCPEACVKKFYGALVRHSCQAYKKSPWVRILTYPTPTRDYGYRRSWYQKSRLYRFEGKAFPGIYEYDAYLRFKFGNYRTLPNEKDRKTHPVTALKLVGDGGQKQERRGIER